VQEMSGAKFGRSANLVKIAHFLAKIWVNDDLKEEIAGVFWGCFLGQEKFCPALFCCFKP
jgi:hypothetical protein